MAIEGPIDSAVESLAPVCVTEPSMVVIGVNFRGSADTIECLASLFTGSAIPYVVVADNASGDGSVDRIASWARGEISTPIANPLHQSLAERALAFPIDYEIIGPDDLSRGLRKPLTIIETGGNLGFSGGNNQGLRAALATPGVDLFWLLNNDTIAAPEAVAAVRRKFSDQPDWGMAGTPIRLYHSPDRFQLVNGQRFYKWTAASTGVMGGERATTPIDAQFVQAQTDFICGASLVLTRDFAEQVGLLEERFFLYFEEIDLALRGKGRFANGFIPEAVVYHKEGASAGSGSQLEVRARSRLAEYHLIRSKMIFCRKHYPHFLPLYFGQNLAIALRRILRGHIPQARAVWRASWGLPL